MRMIDTSAWIDYFKTTGDLQVREEVDALLKRGDASWCEMVFLELQGSPNYQQSTAISILETVLPFYSVDQRCRSQAYELARLCRKLGKLVPNKRDCSLGRWGRRLLRSRLGRLPVGTLKLPLHPGQFSIVLPLFRLLREGLGRRIVGEVGRFFRFLETDDTDPWETIDTDTYGMTPFIFPLQVIWTSGSTGRSTLLYAVDKTLEK